MMAHVDKMLNDAKLDTLIVMGDDQDESLSGRCRPTFAIDHGETSLNSHE